MHQGNNGGAEKEKKILEKPKQGRLFITQLNKKVIQVSAA